MATKDGFQPDRSPIFLSEDAEKAGQPDIGKAWAMAAISSRILKTSILVATAAAIGIAILSVVGDPVALVANVTASWADKPALQPDADPPMPTIQSIASTQDLPPASDATTRDQVAAASEPAAQSQTETGQPLTEALFKQFQSWAAEEDTRAQVEPVQSAQGLPPVQPMQAAPAQVQPVKKHRRVRSVQNARAEVRTQRHVRARFREEQNAPVPLAPVPDPRSQEQAVQTSQTPSFLQSFGLR